MFFFELLFWLSVLIQLYVFLGFVLIVGFLSLFRHRPVVKREWTPSVSVIVTAFNEEKHIQAKIEDCQGFDYPKELIEIIAVSDGCTDATDEILDRLKGPGVKVVRMAQQQGKTACQNHAATVAKNDVLFFTDATVRHPGEALRLLVRSLHDSSVGCVTGRPVFRNDSGPVSVGLSKREKYEYYLRERLASVMTLFGAQDCIYAVPKNVYSPVRADLDGGFVGPLQLLDQGLRTVYEPAALAFVNRPAPNIKEEFIRRSRIALGGMRGLLYMRRLMNPFKHGFIAVSLISTRLLRWLTPVFLILMLFSNLLIATRSFYFWTLVLQVAFYTAAVGAFLVAQNGKRLVFPFYLPLYFCLLAYSALDGLKRLLTGETGQTWQTRR